MSDTPSIDELLENPKVYVFWLKYASEHMTFYEFVQLCLKQYSRVHIDTYV